MTPAEQALFDAALRGSDDIAMQEARCAVLRERLPEGFEQQMRVLAQRYEEARAALFRYEALHPMGHEIRRKVLNEIRGAE